MIFGPCHCVWEVSIKILSLIFNGNLTIYTVYKWTQLTLKWFDSSDMRLVQSLLEHDNNKVFPVSIFGGEPEYLIFMRNMT